MTLDALNTAVSKARGIGVMAVCVAGVFVAGLVDYAGGYEIRTYPLYFGPIAYGAWWLGRAAVMGLASASAAVWVVSNVAAGGTYSSLAIWVWNSLAQLISFALVGQLIVELRRRLALEEGRAREDVLTGLLNRRAFTERAAQLLPLARRSGTPLTLVYLDLDNFKAVNDQHGHESGDQALITMAQLLRDEVRASDLVARLGGDEFAVFLWDTSVEQAESTLMRLRLAVNGAMQAKGWPITLSAGALVYPQAPASLDEALTAADRLMYHAKRAGKDRVQVQVAGAAQ